METVSAHQIVWSQDTGATEKRDVWTALKRGFPRPLPPLR